MTIKNKIPISKPVFGNEEHKAIISVLKSGWYREGKITEKFESKISNYLKSNAVVVNSGSSALLCALIAHGIKSNDKVIVPNFTFIATSSIPKIMGAKIIPVDVDFNTLNMNPEILEKTLKKHKASCVIVVDVGGCSVDLDAFEDLAKRYKFTLIEDAAQAFGAEYKRKKIGSFEHTTVFSFQSTKPITTIEGGCIASKNKGIINKIKSIKDFGRSSSGIYTHNLIGSNFRTTDIFSAIGIEQLKKIDSMILKRNKIFEEYCKQIKNVSFQKIPSYVTKNPIAIVFASVTSEKKRNQIMKKMSQCKIDIRSPWNPIHSQPCNSELKNWKYPNSEMIFKKYFNIPIYNDITKREISHIINSLNKINNKK